LAFLWRLRRLGLGKFLLIGRLACSLKFLTCTGGFIEGLGIVGAVCCLVLLYRIIEGEAALLVEICLADRDLLGEFLRHPCGGVKQSFGGGVKIGVIALFEPLGCAFDGLDQVCADADVGLIDALESGVEVVVDEGCSFALWLVFEVQVLERDEELLYAVQEIGEGALDFAYLLHIEGKLLRLQLEGLALLEEGLVTLLQGLARILVEGGLALTGEEEQTEAECRESNECGRR
jgi:hypothetical protein